MLRAVDIEINETFHAQYNLSISLPGVKVNKRERTCHTACTLTIVPNLFTFVIIA